MNFLRRRPGLGLLLIAGSLVVGLILLLREPPKVYKGSFPVDEVEISERHIIVRPMAETSLDYFIDLSIFGEFRPGMTFRQATDLAGPPDNVRTEKHSIFYEYWRERSRIEVGMEEYSHEEKVRINWFLSAFPKNLSYRDILFPEVSGFVGLSPGIGAVWIRGDDEMIVLGVLLQGERVERVIWYNAYR